MPCLVDSKEHHLGEIGDEECHYIKTSISQNMFNNRMKNFIILKRMYRISKLMISK